MALESSALRVVFNTKAGSAETHLQLQTFSLVNGCDGRLVPILCTQALGVPCFLGGMSRGLLGKNSPIHIRQRRRDALKEADVVILAGAFASLS